MMTYYIRKSLFPLTNFQVNFVFRINP